MEQAIRKLNVACQSAGAGQLSPKLTVKIESQSGMEHTFWTRIAAGAGALRNLVSVTFRATNRHSYVTGLEPRIPLTRP